MSLARVLIVEDDNFARVATATLLSLANFAVIETNSARTALESLKQSPPQVALVDIDLGLGPTGIDVAHAIRKTLPRVGIVFLTSYLDPRFSRAGNLPLPKGSRFIPKSAVTDIASLASTLLSAIHYPLEVTAAPERAKLTDHQIEIVRLVASGFTNAEVAKQTSLSEKSVERTIARVLEKLKIPRSNSLNPRVQLVHAFAELSGKSLPR